MKKIILVALTALCSSCTHVTLRYKGDIETKDGRIGRRKKVDKTKLALACEAATA